MAQFQWQDSFNTGITVVDTQHRKLVGMINLLDRTAVTRAPEGTLKDVLVSLVAYTREHFADEERYMEQIGYAHLEQHRALHRGFTNKIVAVLIDLKEEKNFDPQELRTFLTSWFIRHILTEDKKLAALAARPDATGISEKAVK